MTYSVFRSIRTKLFLLVLISVVPALGIILHSGLKIQQKDIGQSENDALRVVQMLANDLDRAVESTRQFLMALARFPDVQKQDAESCNRLFGELLRENPIYANIFSVTAEGWVFSNALPFTPHSIKERKYFQDVLRTKDFSVGEYVIGVTLKLPVLHFAYPVKDAGGGLKGVVVAAFALDRYGHLFNMGGLAPGSRVRLSDHEHRVLYRYPDHEKYLGKTDNPDMISRMSSQSNEGVFAGLGVDGIQCLYAYKRFYLKGSTSPYLFLRVGIPEEHALSHARAELVFNLILLGGALLLAMVSAWFLGKVLIVKRLSMLLDASQSLGHGDLQTRTGLKHGADELNLLAESFDEMAAQLEKKEAQRKLAEGALRESEENYRNLYENAPIGYIEFDAEGRIRRVNKRQLEIVGYTAEEVLGQHVWNFAVKKDLAKEIIKGILAGTHPSCKGMEALYRRKDGTKVWVLIDDTLVRGDDGRIVGVRSVLQDITERKRAEEALETLSIRQRALLAAIPDIIMEVDSSKTYTWANRAGLDFFGEDVIGKEAVFYFEGEQQTYGLVNPLFTGDENVVYVESWQRRKDGESRLLAWWCKVLKDERGNVTGALSSARDITAARRAEDALRESEENAKGSANDNMIMAEIGRIINSSLEMEEVYERFAEEVQKLLPFDRISVNLVNRKDNTISLDYFAGIETPGRPKGCTHPLPGSFGEHLLSIRKSLLVPTEEIESCAKRFPTLPILQAGIRSIIGVPLYSKGEGIGVLFIVSRKPDCYSERDLRLAERVGGHITSALANSRLYEEKRQSEEALLESEKRFRDLYDHAPVGYQEVDAVGRVTRINSTELEMLGYTADEVLGRPIWEFIEESESSRQTILSKLAGAMPPAKGLERTFRRKDGTKISLLIDDLFVRGGDDRISVIRSTLQDVTERKRAEAEREKLQAQLNQAQKMESVGRLAGGVAHDFNNMLGIIIGNAELAALRIDPAHPVHRSLQDILVASRRSAETVRQLLAFARKQTISPKVLDLNETIEGMLKMLRRLIGEDIDLAWLPGHGLWHVKIDPSQVNQILANLVVNARDAIPEVGRITIETDNVAFDEAYCFKHEGFVPGQYVMLAVSDSGTGMPREVLEHLFEPFFTTKGVGKGTGLGLSTIYGIVKQNSGFVNVYSESGRGTTFKIYLSRSESGSPETMVEREKEKLPRGTETVLMVEDEAAILGVGKAILEELGYKVLTATKPGEAIRLSEENGGINLLLTDVVMPEMNGRDLADHLKDINPNLKCLYTSGYTANVIAHHGVLDEGVIFIQKPFSMMEIAYKVREALDRS